MLILLSEERTSHPIGTTVKVKNFLKSVPVRHQSALKSASKTLARIKALLQGYALARPSVRFTLKTLKAKNDKGNWSYVPRVPATTLNAAAQIYSRSLLDHLVNVNWPQRPETETTTEPQIGNTFRSNFYIEALLPRTTCGNGIHSCLRHEIELTWCRS